jgi:hypothetical protein
MSALSRAVVLVLILSLPATSLAGDDIPSLVAAIKAVKREGSGNPSAAKAWQTLARSNPEALPEILAAFDDDNATATNWIRAAVDAIGERALKEKKSLPAAGLENFLLDTKNSAAGRRTAYEWLIRVDPSAPARLLPRFLRDRSPELRRDAVTLLVDKAGAAQAKGDKSATVAALREALSGACDKDQVDDIAKKLKEQGVGVDLANHFGFIRTWQLVAPFDNPKGRNFAVAYPPEKGVDLKAAYKGKADAECRWTPFTTDDSYGQVNLNKALGKKKGAIAYACVAVVSGEERRAEFRIGTQNALKVFHNGKEVFGCEEYHHGTDMDQYVVPVRLKSGRNEFLVKVCQNEQPEPWAQTWGFQARLCDSTGAAVPFVIEPGLTEQGGRAGQSGVSAP